jgi:uncharacterized integral membrane protein
MLLQILIHTPVVVWALLAGLIALGLAQTRTRHARPVRVLALPALFVGLGLWSLLPGIESRPAVALLWLLALTLGSAAGRRTPLLPGTVWLAAEGRFRVPGSWIPLGFILAIFGLRYASSVAFVLHPEWRADFGLQALLAAVLGLLTGLSVGRAWRLLGLRGTAGAPGGDPMRSNPV